MRISRRSAAPMLAASAVVLALVAPAAEAGAQTSTPPGTLVTMTGDQPGEGYGWAASELADIDGDGAAEVITGNPFHTDAAGTFSGHTDVRSALTGDVIYRFIGRPGELHGYAIAAAGDVNGDRAADFIAGAPGPHSAVVTTRRLAGPTSTPERTAARYSRLTVKQPAISTVVRSAARAM